MCVMKCNHCGKEVKSVTEFFDTTPGAVIVAMDSDSTLCVWPASWGLEKRAGCVEFCDVRHEDMALEDMAGANNAILLSISECKELYLDCPEREEAWLLKPIKDGYEWTRIDEDINFSD